MLYKAEIEELKLELNKLANNYQKIQSNFNNEKYITENKENHRLLK